MNTFFNFRLWVESKERKTFDNVMDALIIQIHPIKIKDKKEFNEKRFKDYDIKLLSTRILNWKMYQDLSQMTKDNILEMLGKENGTLADIAQAITDD